LGHILRFGQLLRLMGVQVSLRQMLDLVEATRYVPVTEQFNFYCAARGTCWFIAVKICLPLIRRSISFGMLNPYRTWQSDHAGSGPGKQARLPDEPDAGPPGEEDGGCVEPVPGECRGASACRTNCTLQPAGDFAQKDFGEMSWEEIQLPSERLLNWIGSWASAALAAIDPVPKDTWTCAA
jgi:hypothetical protein